MTFKPCSLALVLMIAVSQHTEANNNAQQGVYSDSGKETLDQRDSQGAPSGSRGHQQFQQHAPPQQQSQQEREQAQRQQSQQTGGVPQDVNPEHDFRRSNTKNEQQKQPQEKIPPRRQDNQPASQQQPQHVPPPKQEHVPPPKQEHSQLPLGRTDGGGASPHGNDAKQQGQTKSGTSVDESLDNISPNDASKAGGKDDKKGFQSPPAQHLPSNRMPADHTSQQQQQQKQQQEPASTLPQAPEARVMPPILPEEEQEWEDEEGEGEAEEERELTPEEIEGEKLFQSGEKLINATYYKDYKEAYLYFLDASKLNHQKAKEYVAFAHLFGDYLPQNVTKAAELFHELADKGSPKAQMGLSFMYSAGFHYNSSQAKALIYSTFGALGGDPMAQMSLGYRYYAGIGVESKCETALTYYRKVATTVADGVTMAGGPVVQRIRLQEEAESQGTNNSPLLDDDLLQYYHFLADKGDQQAQVVLGTLYYQGGKGVQINHEQAYHYFSTAAESGSGHALGYLGKMHSEGSPIVKQSNHTAFEYFKKSSDKNNHIGQAGLGYMYMNGLGVEKDTSKAFKLFSLASDQGSVDGQLQLGIMYFSGNGVRKDYKMAVKYFTMASQNGHVLAFYNLAQMHATGTGVLRNCHTAVELFKNVAERGRWAEMMMDAYRMYQDGSVDTALVKYMFLAELGYEVAQSNVAYMLDNGVTAKFDSYETYQRALLQYSRAASQGSTHARIKMGDYHYYGLGTDIDYESAATHYRMASEQQHNAQAMFNLGYMHEKGLGLKQDVHLAKRFYDMAAETSLDAHVPVTLALLKLGIFYGVDVFSKEFEGVSGILEMLDPVAYLGPEWDLYVASFFAILFGVIFFLRRMR